MLDKVIGGVKKLTETGIAIIALAVVIQVIFPAGDDPEKGIPFIGTDVVGTITDIVADLGSQGLVGLAAVAVIYAIFTRDNNTSG